MDVEPLSPPAAAHRRRGERTRTIPEQIADHVAAAIVNGEYRDGERLREQELAELYGVSRGPVREAIRELHKHGLVTLTPRRGAFAIGVSVDLVAESFNARAALAGIAARQFTRRRPEAGLAELAVRVGELETLLAAPNVAAITFARAIALSARAIYRHCGTGHIERVLREHFHSTIWGLMWRAEPLDYLTMERRAQTVDFWRRIHQAACAGDERTAERLLRADTLTSRDSVIATLSRIRNETVDPTLMLHD